MRSDRILVAVKRSKWERDLLRYGSEEGVRRLYKIQNDIYEQIHESHLRQLQALAEIEEVFPDARYVRREHLPAIDFSGYDQIFSLGGDNHFVFVSLFIRENQPIFGINSDPDTSQGALLNFSARDFTEQIKSDPDLSSFPLEKWTRIECDLQYPDGRLRTRGLCTSEISIRSSFPDFTSRYRIRLLGERWEEQKSSGLLLSTGAGSTGWYRNCHWDTHQSEAPFPKAAPFFRLIARELRASRNYAYRTAEIGVGQTLEVVSEMDGKISIDAHPETTYEFPVGCTARFRLSDSRLTVARKKT